MCETNNQTFTIPSWNVDKLRNEFNKLAKKASKLGCEPPVLVEQKVEQIVDPDFEQQIAVGVIRRDQAPKITVHTFTIEGNGPKLAGWKFLGTLDHNTIPGSVIVNAVPGETVPQQFFHNDAVCDHCGKIRRRTETFVVEQENGDLKQVGRQCIRDFLGHDPSALIRYLSSLRRFVASLDEEEMRKGSGGSGYWTFNSYEVLKLTNAVIRTFGWVSRTRAAQEYPPIDSTSDIVLTIMAPPFNEDARKARQQIIDKIEWNNEKDEAAADGALQWLEKQTDDSGYLHNLRVLANANDGIPVNMLGYWCSLIAVYLKEQEKLIRAERQKRTSEWYGNVKDKVEITVKVESKHAFETQYGTTRLHKMIDNDGRAFTWFASSASGMEQGHTYRIKGTIKKHDEYNGWKQTILTRVKAIEEVE